MRLILRVIIILAVTAGLYVAADVAVGYFVTPLITAASRDPGSVPAYRGQPYISPGFLAGGRARARRMAADLRDPLVAPPDIMAAISTSIGWPRPRISIAAR